MHDLRPDTLLTREELAATLKEAAGYRVSSATLASMGSRGGGPAFRKFGRRALYRWADAVAWAESKIGPFGTTTAEIRAAREKTKVVSDKAA